MKQALNETYEWRQEKGRTVLTFQYYSQNLAKHARNFLKDILTKVITIFKVKLFTYQKA